MGALTFMSAFATPLMTPFPDTLGSPAATTGGGESTAATSVTMSASRSSSAKHTGFAKGGQDRISLDAPIRERKYHGPSRTAKRVAAATESPAPESPTVVSAPRKRARTSTSRATSKSAPLPVIDDDDEDHKPDVSGSTDPRAAKRLANTLSARACRARKAEHVRLRERVAELEHQLAMQSKDA